MRSILLTTFAVVAICIGRANALAAAPNFLLIFTDDHGYGDVSTYHESDVRTPNIDRIAAEGMLFTFMRANCTVCSPSRAGLLTGRTPTRLGVYDWIRGGAPIHLKQDEITIATLPQIKERLFEMKELAATVGDVVTVQTALATGEVDIIAGGGEYVVAGLHAENPALDVP